MIWIHFFNSSGYNTLCLLKGILYLKDLFELDDINEEKK